MKAQVKSAAARKPAARTAKAALAAPAKGFSTPKAGDSGASSPRKRPVDAAARKSATGQWMSFRKVIARESVAERIRHIRAGTDAYSLVGAAESVGIPREEFFGFVGIATSTANRKIAKRQMLDMAVTERLARLALIEEQAEETFGDKEMARNWLRANNQGLGGCTPLSMLDTEFGTREVVKVLVAIAHGGVA